MAFDLDDEENKATRVANGASKERKEENMEYDIPVETLILCTCENCNKKYEYYTSVY